MNSTCIHGAFNVHYLQKRRCRNTHDLQAYLEQKPQDIRFPREVDSIIPRLISKDAPLPQNSEPGLAPSIDPEAYCSVFNEKGECRHGFKCRFLGNHVKKSDSGELGLVVDQEKVARRSIETSELNYLSPETLKLLRTKKVTAVAIKISFRS